MAAPKASRGIRWLLIASLSLNLVVFGVLAGAWLKGGPPPGSEEIGFWHYTRVLPEADRRALGRALRETRGDWTGLRQELSSERARFTAALTAEPFAVEPVEAALRRELSLSGAIFEHSASLLAAQIARMTPEERAAFAEALERDRDRGRGREAARRMER